MPNTFDLTPYGRLNNIPEALRGLGVQYPTPGATGGTPGAGGGGVSLQTLLPLLQALRTWAIPSAAPATASMALGGDQGPAAFQGANYQRMLNAQGQPQVPLPSYTQDMRTAGSSLMQLLRARLARQPVATPATGGY